MIISLIAAIGLDHELGQGGRLIWRIPEDLKQFKRLTMGHHMLMGRKTYESIGRPLPGRVTIVLSRDLQYQAPGCLLASSIDEALTLARHAGERELMVCGGAEVYRALLPSADQVYVSKVQARASADVFFPTLHEGSWVTRVEQPHAACEKSGTPAWTFMHLIKTGTSGP